MPPIGRLGTISEDNPGGAQNQSNKHHGDYMFDTQWTGKDDQMNQVREIIKKTGMIPNERVDDEVAWFYDNLGIEDRFFTQNNPEKLADFVHSVYGSKIVAHAQHGDALEIQLEAEIEGGNAIYVCNSRPGVSVAAGPQYEQKIDAKYLNREVGDVFRVETYRSAGSISWDRPEQQVRCYFVEKCVFEHENVSETETDMKLIAEKSFLERATEKTIEMYSELMRKAVHRTGPVTFMSPTPDPQEIRCVIAFRRGGVTHFFSTLSDLYHFYDMYSTRKYVEQFANGMVVVSIYLRQVPNSSMPSIDRCMHQLLKEVSLLYLLPVSQLHRFFLSKELSVRETSYAYAGWRFAEHFLNRLGPEYSVLKEMLEGTRDDRNAALLNRIKTRLRLDTFTSRYIMGVIESYPHLIKILYNHFAFEHRVAIGDSSTKRYGTGKSLVKTMSAVELEEAERLSTQEISELIKRTVNNSNEVQIFECLLTFNKHILKTNFFQPTKVALSFRLDPSFLPEIEYPRKPYGVFFVLGHEFRGFHVRFGDVARGGIRIIRSINSEVYSRNVASMFDENYNLAHTQQLKNKDIPEGGSKGTILLDVAYQDHAVKAFKKYVDAILDLLLVGQSPGIKDTLVDRHQKEEILFFGPDEGTADLMNWASNHARKRGAPFWKAFTTGKSREFGGIPHDMYGMTTRSVHQYVLGVLEKENIAEETATKIQTGGPDGDLGSNEIKISKDKTIAVVDGSGVLFDPEGINRPELLRLATSRIMVDSFDATKLGPSGFRVLVSDRDVVLPDGTVIQNGMNFRNNFHVSKYAKATLFVPCGGRPESININNVGDLLGNEENNNTPNFKYIVEGANLFITQIARFKLEKAGVVVFKDASANKGGVTSSSLEVFSGLALSDEEHSKHMCVNESGEVPQFYQDYVKAVQNFIEENARLEFECIWREHERTGKSRIEIADTLSLSITTMRMQLMQSKLWEDKSLRSKVLSAYCPNVLLDLVGLDNIIKRVPNNYLKAIFSAFLASRFVYKYGLETSPFSFYEYVSTYMNA